MFNNSAQGVSVLSFSLMSAVKDFIMQHTEDEKIVDGVSFFNHSGDIFLPLAYKNLKRKLHANNFPHFDFEEGGKPEGYLVFNDFRSRYLSNTITTIPYNETISLSDLLQQLAESDEVYGVVIENTELTKKNSEKFLFNPLHPINAFLISAGVIELPLRGKLHIFEWNTRANNVIKDVKESGFYNEKMEYYKEQYADLFSLFPKIIKSPIVTKQWATINSGEVTALLESPFIEMVDTHIDVHKHEGQMMDRKNVESLIIPTHLAISGIVMPYYGIIAIDNPTESNATGFNLTPMISGNIHQKYRSNSETYNGNRRNNASERNICTGSESMTSIKGWFTLSKVNINSMFFGEIIEDGARGVIYADIAKKISAEIWKAISEAQEEELVQTLEEAEETITES